MMRRNYKRVKRRLQVGQLYLQVLKTHKSKETVVMAFLHLKVCQIAVFLTHPFLETGHVMPMLRTTLKNVDMI
jgi:CelD/BcsL family acetyltransferase involved in cellulose biosynthesis